MIITRKFLTSFIAFIFLFTLSGCSIPTDFYLQNLTGTKKIIKINYSGNIVNSLEKDTYGRFSFNYIDDVVNPRLFKREKNIKSLGKIKIDSTSITVEMGPESTMRVEKAHNYHWNWRIASIEIDDKVYTIKELNENSDKIKNDYIFKIK